MSPNAECNLQFYRLLLCKRLAASLNYRHPWSWLPAGGKSAQQESTQVRIPGQDDRGFPLCEEN